MPKQPKTPRWTLRDLVDLEVLIEKAALWKKAWREQVREDLGNTETKIELDRRRLGFRMMLEHIRGDEHEEAGQQLVMSAKMLSFLMWLLMLLLGFGVLRGLLMKFEYTSSAGELLEMSGFNIWILLGVALGLQWLMILGATAAFWLWRRWSGGLGVIQSLLQTLLRKWGGEKLVGDAWHRVQSRVSGGRSVISWRLMRILQAGGIGYNCGLLAGFFACLWFFEIGFYWESTLPQFGRDSLLSVTEVLSFSINEIQPDANIVDQAKRGALLVEGGVSSFPKRNEIDVRWAFFFLFAIFVWGLLPRLFLWVAAVVMERRALASLDFQESRHRTLWRDLTKVQRGEIRSGAADGVVLLDIGGLEMETEKLRPFCLQVMRVNPEQRFSLGTLDEDSEKHALEQARTAAMGVVFLVEGWSLSPKQMEVYHDKVRAVIGETHMIRYLILGNEDEMKQWEAFVDSLKDSESEVIRYSAVD